MFKLYESALESVFSMGGQQLAKSKDLMRF